MYPKIIGAIVMAFAVGTGVQAATPEWVRDFVGVRAPQTKVVRHPRDKNKFYLCWQEGANRYGLAFRRSNFDAQLRRIRPGDSTSLAALLPMDQGNWSADDEKACWG